MNEKSNKSFGQTLNEAPTEEVWLENFSINHTACSAICVFVCLHVTCFDVPSAFFFFFTPGEGKPSLFQGYYMDTLHPIYSINLSLSAVDDRTGLFKFLTSEGNNCLQMVFDDFEFFTVQMAVWSFCTHSLYFSQVFEVDFPCIH